MAKKKDDSTKVIADGGFFVLELFGANQSQPKSNESLFERPAPNEWKIKWPRNIDFLFVCTGFCVGLGNLWRFPSVALQFGGGSFLVAYLIILLFIGFPIFYLEVVVGQFVSRAGARMFECVPLMRGLGYGQMTLSFIVASYYSGITAIAGKFLIASIRYTLPWSVCPDKSDEYCMGVRNSTGVKKSFGKAIFAELYYRQNVIPAMREVATIESWTINYELIIYLCICWIAVTLIVNRGLRMLSHLGGFLLFAFLSVCLVFLAQMLVLPGGFQGVTRFFTLDWTYFASTKIWFAALVQVFFSLGICFGPIAMYSSFNRFSYNMFVDIMLANFINVLVAVIAGCTLFAAIGIIVEASHLRFEDFSGRFNYNTFILLSEVVAKFDYVPQITSAILFFLFCLLGIASVSMFAFFIIQMIRDELLTKKTWKVTVCVSIGTLLVSLIYLAPAGEHLTILLDSYGIPFAIVFNSILELIAIAWMYGVKRVCDDIEFMFGFSTRFFWRVIWFSLPAIVIAIFLFHLIWYGILQGSSPSAHVVGYCIGCIFITIVAFTILVWSIFVLLKQPKLSFYQRLKQASSPNSNWGPADSSLLLNYRYYILKKDNNSI